MKKDYCSPPLQVLEGSFSVDYDHFIEELPNFIIKELDLYDHLWESYYQSKKVDIDFEGWEKDIALSLANHLQDVVLWIETYCTMTKKWKKIRILPN